MTSVGPRCPDHATQGAPRVRPPVQERARRRLTYAQSAQPIVTWGLIGLNVVIYLITVAQGAGVNSPGGSLFAKWALYGPAVANGGWWRLGTAAFLHASVLHIGLNMVVLYMVGIPVERFLGPWRYLTIYIVSGLAGSAGALVVDPTTVTVGASGAIFGLFGALFIIEYQQTGAITGQAFTLIAINLVLSFAIPNISWGGHVGGLIGGILATLALSRLGRSRSMYGRPGVASMIALLVLGVPSILIAYWKVRGYA
jgi:membrane associated rhomboid family serine protease